MIPDENLFPFSIDINQPKLIAFVDAVYANDQHKRQFTTGFVFTYGDSTIVYCSKTQSITTVSFTEAEFLAAVSCAKIALYLQSILYELGFECNEPTPIYKDNASTILIYSAVSTEHTQHIYVKYFAIQDWKEWGCIQPIHIPGILNPSSHLTKPLGWVVHSRHYRQFMRHFA